MSQSEGNERHGVKIVGIRTAACPQDGPKHVVILKLESGNEIGAADAMSLMDVGRSYFMIPPPGAPAYAAHVKTGLPLLIQTRKCPGCEERVLFA